MSGLNTERFEKIVLMLSSDQPGEVFNAAQAIGRQLPAAGLDWHKFAKLIVGRLCKPEQPSSTGYTHTTSDVRDDQRAERDNPQYMSAFEVEMCRKLMDLCGGKLKDSERDFLGQRLDRFAEYGSKTFITPKQRDWLHGIWERFS